MKKKGFTLIELLVVIAIIAMLLAILMPALNKVKRLAQRLICGTNCKGLGTALMVYAQDFEDDYPVQGGNGRHRWSEQGRTQQWYNPDKNWNDPKWITVSASLYLLVRNADVDPKSFVCKSSDQTPFKGVAGNANLDLVELWDFGGWDLEEPVAEGTVTYNEGMPKEHVSYAYQLPYEAVLGVTPAHPVSATSSASTAVLADKNPWCDPKLEAGREVKDIDTLKKDFTMYVHFLGGPGVAPDSWNDTSLQWLRDSSSDWRVQIANSQAHNREGQNVLFGDGHSSFEKRPDVGYQNDNIYTMWGITGGDPPYNEYDKRTGMNRPIGKEDPLPDKPSYPRTSEDSLLVNDDSRYPGDHNFP